MTNISLIKDDLNEFDRFHDLILKNMIDKTLSK